MAHQVTLLMLGAIAMGCFVAGLVFMRYWRDTRDRFFLLFALSFFAESVSRVLLAASARPNEASPWIYGIRLLAYGLILWAIWEKNRTASARAETPRRDQGNAR